MAIAYKVLGQSKPAATTATTLYTVPSSTETIISTLTICNLGVSTTYRIAIRPNGATLADQHYIVYDAPINQYDSIMLTLGLSLDAADVITIYAGTANVSFNVFGSEIS